MLSDRSRSDAFDALTEEWAAVCNSDVFPVIEAAGDAVRAGATVTSNVITSYKLTLISILSVNVAVDLVALAVPGPGTAVAAGRVATMRVFLRVAFQEAAQSFASAAMKAFGDAFETFVIGPIEIMFARIREAIVDHIAADIVANAFVRGATTSTAGALYIDYHDVVEATKTLRNAYDELESKLGMFDSHAGHQEFTEPDYQGVAERDSLVRSQLREVIEWSVGAIVRLLADVGQVVLNDLCALVMDTYDKYVAADAELAASARALRESLLLRPSPLPYSIDRTSRPRPIVVWEDPPEEIFTGQAVSDARFDISTFEIVDAPDPVVTGVATSDARFDITIIDLPDAVDPTATGVAESTARDGIRRITLPDLSVPDDAESSA